MKKITFTISPSNLKKLHEVLKKHEDKHPDLKIGTMKASHFLALKAQAAAMDDTPAIATKRIILKIAGDFTTQPEDLADIILLKENLNYGQDEFSILQVQLDRLVKKNIASASVTTTETNKCKAVGDCIKLITNKIQQT